MIDWFIVEMRDDDSRWQLGTGLWWAIAWLLEVALSFVGVRVSGRRLNEVHSLERLR